jgi:actin-like ATPase involved in cell morphogenesis
VAYYLGIDIGTTYTAAAVWRDGRYDVASLGNRAATIPSVVLLRDDETVLTGEAAARRAATEPQRVAREFKRRLGDPTPIIVAGTPYSADALIAKLLRWVVDRVAEAEGGPAAGIAVTHPANWGTYKLDLLRQAIRIADLDNVATLSEPEAAAIHYASQSRVETGAVIAVYDLGGGTFDAAVLRKTDSGWETLGQPEGIERLGGVDFDAAVFHHVVGAVDGAVDQLDPDDPAAAAAVARLRQECVEAKEALSSDTDVSIPVLLPNLQTEVRLTRAEYEQMVRPALADSITATNRALRSAGVSPEQVTAVLLVGGSSRTPLVSELVGSALGRPVAVDAHPKHGVALGAAIQAAQHGQQAAPASDRVGSRHGGTPERATGPVAAAGAAGLAAAAATPPGAPPATPPPGTPPPAGPAPGAERPPERGVPARASFPAPASPPPTRRAAAAGPPPGGPPPGRGGGGHDGVPPPVPEREARSRRPLLVAGAVAAVLLAGVGAAVALSGGDDPGADAGADTTAAPGTTEQPTTTPTAPTTTLPDGPFVNIDEVVLDGDVYRVNYRVSGYEPDVEDPDALHIHFFLDTTAPENAGNNGTPRGLWELTDETATYLTSYGPDNKSAARQMCAAVATFGHDVFERGTTTGNCVDLPA